MGLNYHAIGIRIHRVRKHRNLSQAMLSELIDRSPTYVSYIETGTKSMSLDTFVQIANALVASTDYLLSDQLDASAGSASKEVSLILDDCTEYEKRVLIDMLRGAKIALREYEHLSPKKPL